MHAQQTIDATNTASRSLTPVADLKPGRHFVRVDSPSEVLVLMTHAGLDVTDAKFAWAVVIAVNHDSEGYVPGQLLKLRRDTQVRVVHEARAPVFALEH